MRVITENLRKEILDEYYFKHHAALMQAVHNQLSENGTALIIDCHSFSDIPFKRDLNKRANRPDFNIGTDIFHTPDPLIRFTNDSLNPGDIRWAWIGPIQVPWCQWSFINQIQE
jgi:N-formylglutamate amidohydrolase